VQRAVIGAGLSSETTIKAALLLNGMQKGPGDQFRGLSETRGAGSFDVHEHVIVAPSHLLFFNLAGPLLQQVYNALSVLQRDEFVDDMRACSRYVPRHTVLKAFEPEKMGGTTLSMSDCAVLLTIAPTVLDDMHSETVLPALAVSVLAALKALRAFANALFFRPTIRNDGENAVRCKPTVHTLQLLGCSLLKELASLTSKGINWEKPSVHRVLELLYRTLPLVQIGPAICELLFEKFHQVSKREIERSNSHDPAGFSMQRWRDVEMLSRVVAAPAKYGIPQEWLTDPNGQETEAVLQHKLGFGSWFPDRRTEAWSTRGVQQCSHVSAFWIQYAAGRVLRFWKSAKSNSHLFKVHAGATIAVLQTPPTQTDANAAQSVPEAVPELHFYRVLDVPTIEKTVFFSCQRWLPRVRHLVVNGGSPQTASAAADGGQAMVELEDPSRRCDVACEGVKELALALPSGSAFRLFSKQSSFPFKCG